MKFLTYILLCIVGFSFSYYILKNCVDKAYLSVLVGFWTGYFGHMILNWEDKK